VFVSIYTRTHAHTHTCVRVYIYGVYECAYKEDIEKNRTPQKNTFFVYISQYICNAYGVSIVFVVGISIIIDEHQFYIW